MMTNIDKLKTLLDTFYQEFDFQGRIKEDPIEFPHRYSNQRDIETSGFIASCFAYGRVKAFKVVIGTILDRMGDSPYEFLSNLDAKRDLVIFKDIIYRFNSNQDIVGLIFIIHRMMEEFGSIENTFMKFYKPQSEGHNGQMYQGQTGFIEYIRGIDVNGVCEKTAGLLQFFPSPAQGSTCKRLNMFLRWMVRDADIDFGIWQDIPKSELIIPLDTHMARISRCLQLTDRLSNDYKTAIEITNNLKMIDPEDPVKYDFSLCHHGISGACSSKSTKANCEGCAISCISQ
jgi:uncharacterized protein (TIGR02757 family)